MRKLCGILGSVFGSVVTFVAANLIAYGTSTNFGGLLVISSILGMVAGIIICIFDRGDSVNRARCMTVGAAVYVGLYALFGLFMLSIPDTHLNTISLPLVALGFMTMAVVGGGSGFGYAYMGSRALKSE